MIDEKQIGKNLEVSGHEVIEVLPQHLPEETEENHKNPQQQAFKGGAFLFGKSSTGSEERHLYFTRPVCVYYGV
jgi:hypothetical protein